MSSDESELVGSTGAEDWPIGAVWVFLTLLKVRGGTNISASSDATLFPPWEQWTSLDPSYWLELDSEGGLCSLISGALDPLSRMARFFALVLFVTSSFFVFTGTT